MWLHYFRLFLAQKYKITYTHVQRINICFLVGCQAPYWKIRGASAITVRWPGDT